MKNLDLTPDTYKLPSEMEIEKHKKAISRFLKMVNKSVFLNQNVFVKILRGMGVLQSLKDNPFFKKVCIIDCQHLCIAVIENLKSSRELGQIYIFDNVERTPHNVKDSLFRMLCDVSPAIILCDNDNFQIPVYLAERCTLVNFTIENKEEAHPVAKLWWDEQTWPEKQALMLKHNYDPTLVDEDIDLHYSDVEIIFNKEANNH